MSSAASAMRSKRFKRASFFIAKKSVRTGFDDDVFYSEKNVQYLEQIMQDVRDNKAQFEEHSLIEVD